MLSEQARAAVQLEDLAWTLAVDAGAPDRTAETRGEPDRGAAAPPGTGPTTPLPTLTGPKVARALASRLTATLKAPALRLIELALHEDVGDLILAVDRDQPQALFHAFAATTAGGRNYALLRRIIASAPCWALPYGELVGDDSTDPGAPGQAPPTELETVAGAGLAAMCRPGSAGVLETAAARLDDNGRVDE